MADSIPSLRRKLDEALAELDALRAALREPQTRTIYQDRIVEVPTVVYITDPDLIAANQALKERVCQLESLLASELVVEK